MRLITRAAAACSLACALAVGVATSAHAEVPVSQVGWWTRAPSPPTVPDGGVAVGAAPDGDLTVGAVVLDAGDGASGVGLRLVETGGQGQAIASIVVCPTTSTWAPAAGGPMVEAPPSESCASSAVPMTRAADGTWTADLAFAEGKSGPVGLLVKPAAGSVAFQVSFAPPTVTGTVSTAASGETVAEPASEPATSPAPAPALQTYTPSPMPTPTVATPTSVATTVPIVSGTEGAGVAAPAFGGVPSAGGGDDESDVTAMTVVTWYVLAAIVGLAAAGIAWARNEGRLSLEGLASLVRLRR